MRIGFFGTPDLAASVLQDLIESEDMEVVCIVTNPDKPTGRSQTLTPTPVKSLGLTHNIPVHTPMRIRDNLDFLDTLRSYRCEYFVVVAYGRILPMELLQIPSRLCVNVHGSILPAYRGASPIQSALLHGESETGVTIMQMSAGMDEGDILRIQTIPIEPHETGASLFDKFALSSGGVLISTLRDYHAGLIQPIPQDHSLATYCKKIEKEHGLINWSQSAQGIYQMWQAYTPWPGIYTTYRGKRLLLEQVVPSDLGGEVTGVIGQVICSTDGQIHIICGNGSLRLDQIKLEGKKSQQIQEFLNGNQDFIGSIL